MVSVHVAAATVYVLLLAASFWFAGARWLRGAEGGAAGAMLLAGGVAGFSVGAYQLWAAVAWTVLVVAARRRVVVIHNVWVKEHT